MSTDNQFKVYSENQAGNEIQCPYCDECIIPDNGGSTIADLRIAAKRHLAEVHAPQLREPETPDQLHEAIYAYLHDEVFRVFAATHLPLLDRTANELTTIVRNHA